MSRQPEDFEAKLHRLKRTLGVREDQEVAEALGMTKAAFSARKQRSSFPVDRLLVLSTKRADLDVTYVLTGDRQLTGPARDRLELTARRIGSRPDVAQGTGAHLADLVADHAHWNVEFRARRRALYEAFLDTLDGMSDTSVNLLAAVATRMATADRYERPSDGGASGPDGGAPGGPGAGNGGDGR